MQSRHWRSNKKNYLSNSNSNTSKSYLSMQLSSKFSSKSYLSNAVSSNFFILGSSYLGIHIKKIKKWKKPYGVFIGTYLKYSKFWNASSYIFSENWHICSIRYHLRIFYSIRRKKILPTLEIWKKLLQIYCYQNFLQ